MDASGTSAARALRKLVNVDAGRGDASAAIVAGEAAAAAVAVAVVVQACVAGLPCVQLAVPTSADAHDAPFEVAARSVALADISG